MGRFRKWRALIEPESLPADVFAALTDDLYGPLVSFAVGASTATLVGGIAAARTGNPWLIALTATAAVVAATRMLVTLLYRGLRPTIGGDSVTVHRWERLYAIGASAYAACLGGMCFVGFVFTDDPISHLLLSTNAIGYTAGATSRNSSRPRIAMAQLSLILLPFIAGAALRLDTPYVVLSGLTFLYYLAAIEIVQYLGVHRLRLLTTTREKAELAQSLAEQNLRFDTALANMSHGLCMFDARQRLVVWNRRFCEIYGIEPEALYPAISVRELIELIVAGGNYPGQTVDALTAEFEARLARGNASRWKRSLPSARTIALFLQPVTDGGAVAIVEDVTERETAEARAHFLATHDDLTELPNRMMFGQAVGEAVKVAMRYGEKFAVMFVDLDRFKIINDTLGHAAGDSLLMEIASRLKDCVRASDVVARLGGDEFVILLREVLDAGDVTKVARKILSAIVKPMMINQQECRVTASIGISMFPSDAQDEESLSKNADAAMYVAKEAGRNSFAFYSGEIRARSIERLMLETSLRRALERNELLLYYQPKRNLRRGCISGVEALLRWQHPDLGLLQPNRFISLAEETGLIVQMGKWVLEAACAQSVAWQKQGLPAIPIAVNLSPRQFADPNLLEDIQGALEKSGMAPQLLELEITESMVMQNVERTVRVLEAIKRLGITVAMDDFGTGYSSMSMVMKFPIDTLKIDRSFMRDIMSDPDAMAIAKAIIALGRALDLNIVAEGVETVEQESFLREQNCDEVQGYLISRPIPPDQFVTLLASDILASLKAQVAELGRRDSNEASRRSKGA